MVKILGSLYILTVRCKYNEAETMWVWSRLDMQKRRERLVILQAIQGRQEVYQPKITYSSTKTRKFSEQSTRGCILFKTNRSCVLDTENKHKKPVKSTTEGHGHIHKKIVFFCERGIFHDAGASHWAGPMSEDQIWRFRIWRIRLWALFTYTMSRTLSLDWF